MKNRLVRVFTLLFAVALLLLPLSGLAAQAQLQAKNVIILIGDGMGPSQFGAAWIYSNRILNRDLRMSELMKKGRTAYLVNDTGITICTRWASCFGPTCGWAGTARPIPPRRCSCSEVGPVPRKSAG